ncbi:CpsB/CapC family capsule biosynthesis tyrosine phosphatase [sulfur-oxidizing endosymbiont of Gigantopelta aegis]|uniref:CpsB/CapC family capsule biosynthesis tyrosine phosphatase n=1 Tax=sulfur-oxidizing endosymbiont of Gigantopelta aegis TaxID=2794934 RepID=UPI0018DC5E00|nr:CpsB/CapC family capsule biosynthesis tyrosine phosphatase [sulfur-oxidizing endosymbiont of Gigantopelta aegis]
MNWLLKRNIKPIIVHPERNKEIQADFTKIAPFLKAGCLLQITANSVVGKFGSKSQQVAQTLLEKQWVDFIATDAHNLKHRPPT